MEQKIKQDNKIQLGRNIRRLRLEKGFKQTEMVALLQMENISMTREALVKIERGVQHVTVTQLRGIRNVLDTTYEELLK
ncbi:MAG: helix-turn-helix domain-containing protein [Lachnospiraceae bacterium]|nr:helix-turn-helix domain-containing protein [Lachnospiraceae bacterium]